MLLYLHLVVGTHAALDRQLAEVAQLLLLVEGAAHDDPVPY